MNARKIISLLDRLLLSQGGTSARLHVFLSARVLREGMSGNSAQTILLAEDDDAMRVYLERALVNAGYAVDAVDRGTSALPLLEENSYDLLLSDIVMPEMDGIELAQHCNEISPATKVMFITGFAAVTLKASREQPHAKVLSKPFHLRELVDEVERVMAA